VQQVRLYPNYTQQGLFYNDPATTWFLAQLDGYLRQAFFFSPFRHSTPQLPAQGTDQLSQDGVNLVQVLTTVNKGNSDDFQEIEMFVQAALPNIGRLQTPFISGSNHTEISFRFIDGNYHVPLHDMGGGIEQLLMVAVVLTKTGDESTLFLEEPESHLHAGAQRFLIDKLYQGNRQIFITTHSPIFVNISRPKSIYRVVQNNRGRAEIIFVDDPNSLGATLEDIGVRNSDVLLSDAVLFVEGDSDENVLSVWSKTLNTSLAEYNITVLHMSGGEHADRRVPIRSEVLEGISKKSPVPHLFVLDQDERSIAEIKKSKDRLGEKVVFLQRRELENYLLVPRALRDMLMEKYQNEVDKLQRIQAATDMDIKKLLQGSADSLYDLVLIKRVRSELAGLRGGFILREDIEELVEQANDSSLPDLLHKKIQERVNVLITLDKLKIVINTQKQRLDEEWADTEKRLWLAPGEELLAKVFIHFNGKYDKTQDAKRIARHMNADEIFDEIKSLISNIIRLTTYDKK
jgi:predicted ATP-dependent endonuclease of OLD family